MKLDEYASAIDQLEFSEINADQILAKAAYRPGLSLTRRVLIAAVLACFMVMTAFGAVAILRQRPAVVVPVGTDAVEMDDASYLEFSVDDVTAGVEIHYMELNPIQQYHFRHGMLWSNKLGYHRITDDYQIEPVEMNQVVLELEKNSRVYTLTLDYLETANGIITNHQSVYHKNENGEILLNVTDGNSGQWPVYFHVENGTIRDALPDWNTADFEGCVVSGVPFMGGILISAIADEDMPTFHKILYWIAPGADEARIIELPGDGVEHVEHNTLFYQDQEGRLYRMNEEFRFELICEYKTLDYLQDGLMTVSVNGRLGILDAYTGELYVLEELSAHPWDTMNYRAIRYGANGTIALVHSQCRHDPEQIVLCTLGVLDKETAKLQLLEIEHDLNGYQHGWLDENRFAVIYQSDLGQKLCVYEFGE